MFFHLTSFRKQHKFPENRMLLRTTISPRRTIWCTFSCGRLRATMQIDNTNQMNRGPCSKDLDSSSMKTLIRLLFVFESTRQGIFTLRFLYKRKHFMLVHRILRDPRLRRDLRILCILLEVSYFSQFSVLWKGKKVHKQHDNKC